jgi:hypothetical protein
MSLQSWQDFAAWLRNLKLPSIDIDHDYLNDTITVRNRDTMKNQRISRFVLETMDADLRKELFLQMISNTMKTPSEIVHDQLKETQQKAAADALDRVTGWISAPATSGVYSAGGGGGGGIAMPVVSAGNFGNVIRGAIGAPAYVDEYYAQQEEQLQTDLLRSKLFNYDERMKLAEVKRKVLEMFHSRLAEERAIPFHREKLVIAGGCFASLINDDPIYDVDVFLLDDQYNHGLAKGMAETYMSEEAVTVPNVPVMSSANTVVGHISLNSRKHMSKTVKIGNSNYMENDKIEQTIFFKHSKMQYITTKYKTREELINHFDFKHCCVSYDFATDKLYITREVYDLIKNKRLLQNGIKRPAHWRFEKFYNRGWKEDINLVDDLIMEL